MGRQLHQIVSLLCLLLTACVKDRPSVSTLAKSNGKTFVVCEGSYGNGNASLWSYDAVTNNSNGDVFVSANNLPLGDVFQSMTRSGSSYLLCINNSDKIYAIDTGSLLTRGSIRISKPRYTLPTKNNTAFVSTLYSNKIEVIDPSTLTITKSISLPFQNPEGMCRLGSKVYVCAWDTVCNKLIEIDENTNEISRIIAISGYAPHAVLADNVGMLWILSGNVTKGKQAALTRIDPSTGATLKSFKFTAGKDPIKPVFNPARDTLYFIQVKYDGTANDNGIYRMSINDTTLPTTPFIQATTYQYFWALGIQPSTGNIFVGDPKGFVQKGTITVYRPDGATINTFDVGIGPGQFYFGN
ncbi:MAG: hypothetical protein KF744_11860 [Taibaiella sp.]|nr:hypothetical protein [Taibaiella sp.]